MEQLLYEEVSRQIIGIAFKVFNALGYGVREQFLHRAFGAEFSNAKLEYQHEVTVPLTYAGTRIGTYRLDFVVRDCVVVEIKVAPFVQRIHVRQVLEYLRATKKRLALLIFFTPDGVRMKRVILPTNVHSIRSASA